MKRLEEEFVQLAEKHFDFLIDDFDFKLTNKKVERQASEIEYQRPELAFVIQYDQRDFMCFLWMIRKIKGKVTEKPIFIKQKEPVNWFDFNDVLAFRKPDMILTYKYFGESITEVNLEGWLQHQAECLKKYGQDLLNGDTEIFDQLERIIKQRALENN